MATRSRMRSSIASLRLKRAGSSAGCGASADAGSAAYAVTSEYQPKPKGKDSWDEIPFTFVGAQNNDPTIDDSPLAALVEINHGHFRNSADYEDSVWFCGQVQPYMTGLDEGWRDHLEKKGVKIYDKYTSPANCC